MDLAGVSVEDRLVRELAAMLNKPLRSKLEQALLFRSKIVGLSWSEREAVLAALEHAPPSLEEVRELLLLSDSWRLRQRLQ